MRCPEVSRLILDRPDHRPPPGFQSLPLSALVIAEEKLTCFVFAVGEEDWSLISTKALLEELAKRDDGDSRPQCGSGEKGSYNTMLHLLAVLVILSVSTICKRALLCCILSDGPDAQPSRP